MKIYIVARPYEEIEEFIPMYITTYEDKARCFLSRYTDESIMLVIFSKEWNPNDPKGSPNILFNYLDGDLTCSQIMTKKNTLYNKYKCRFSFSYIIFYNIINYTNITNSNIYNSR